MDRLLLHQSIRRNARAAFSRSGGPGGQNVNKVNTKVTLRILLSDLEGLNDAELARLGTALAGRITEDGEIIVSSDEERSQHVNRERAYARLEALIAASARIPRTRKPTKPSRLAREERLNSKRLRSIKKTERRFRPED